MHLPSIEPRAEHFPHRILETLRFADTDRNGHITNSAFAICCQNARMELLCDPRRVPVPSNTQFVVARLLLEFRAEMHCPGTVEIGTRIDRVGRSSVALAQALFVGEDCVATSQSVVVLIDAGTRCSICLPAPVRFVTTGPVAIPIRTPSLAFGRLGSSATAATMASPVRTARSASSSCACG